MIKELEPMETPNGDNILYVKMNEAIRALNAIEAASTSTNNRVMPCPKFVPGAICELYPNNRCSTIRSCLITVTA
jgi:hypothetical protein